MAVVEANEAELYFPGEQRVHDVAPALEINPGQSRHRPAPTPLVYLVVYEATKPEDVDNPSDVNRTLMCPVDDVTGPGTVEPLNGLPGSSVKVVDEHDDDEHEYTLTRSLPDSVLKLVNESISAVPEEDDIVTEQSALLL